MHRDRTLIAFALALLGLAVYPFVRPSSPDPVDNVRAMETRFYIDKTHQKARYDGVIVGDSRALRGLSPGEISNALGGSRIYNFAFSACGLDGDIFAEAEALLDPGSRQPFVILAPSALSFQPWKRANAQFREYKAKPRDQVWLYQELPELAMWLQPHPPSIYLRRLFHIMPAELLEQEFHADGWIATNQTPFDDLRDIDLHRRRMEGHTIDPAMINELMQQTREWTDRGIRVFAFYHPAQPERTAMEDSMLGFDRAAFGASFAAMGGAWLEVSEAELQTYDGSHLISDSAVALSRELGETIKRAW